MGRDRHREGLYRRAGEGTRVRTGVKTTARMQPIPAVFNCFG
jgi:hypothetical protein